MSNELHATRLTILGSGAVAHALGTALGQAGAELTLWARRRSRLGPMRTELVALARGSARRVRVEADLGQAIEGVDGLLLCVSDRAVAELAAACAQASSGSGRMPVALHTSGYHDAHVLAPLEDAGWAVGSLHPLVPLPPLPAGKQRRVAVSEGAGLLCGQAWFATEGTRRARSLARRLVAGMGGHELALRQGAEAKRAYHAAASLLSGGTAALFDAALSCLGPHATGRAAASGALASLLEKTALNLAAKGPARALTGAASRGEVDLIAGHLAAFVAQDGDGPGSAAQLYRELVRRMLALGVERGTVEAGSARRIATLLDGGRAQD